MGVPGVTDSTVNHGLWDVLTRQPEVVSIEYRPNSISKQFIRATIDPDRFPVPTGPKSPALDVEWRYYHDDMYYRIQYHDPNTGFNCGWHRDDSHPELGAVHFQDERPTRGDREYRPATFTKTAPTGILWEAVDRLFDTHLPTLANG